mmetsp:Transcript_12281/g.33760  ORF Transcript_12281/g.33760 Transcript_12281/m.33760 type:complete len:201 (-) Transcript_12281:584-1186(-)
MCLPCASIWRGMLRTRRGFPQTIVDSSRWTQLRIRMTCSNVSPHLVIVALLLLLHRGLPVHEAYSRRSALDWKFELDGAFSDISYLLWNDLNERMTHTLTFAHSHHCKVRKADAIESSDPSHTTDFAEMQISQVLRNVTVVYLFTFPTLLIKLVPLLAKMESVGRLRCVVTQTYHLPAETATVSKVDAEFDFKMYDSIAS